MKAALFYFIIQAILALIILMEVTFAQSVNQTHAAAHVGMSWVITDVVYGSCKAITGKEVPCLVTGILASTAAGLAKEGMDNESKKKHARGYLMDAIGILGASVFITIDW